MSVNSDTRKFQDNRFYADIKKYCLDDLFKDKQIQLKKNRRIFMILPSLDEARAKWNHLQQYEYNYHIEEDDDGIVFDNEADYDYDSD